MSRPDDNDTSNTKELTSKTSGDFIRNKRESVPIYGTSIGWSAGRSSIFTFLSYFGPALGATPFEQSIIVSVKNLGSNLFQSVWGWLADLEGRKLVLMIGLGSLVVTTFFTPFVQNPFQLVIISLLMSTFGFSFVPAWNAFLGDYSSEKIRASFIGKINSIGTYISVISIFTMGILMDSLILPFPSKENVDSIGLPFSGNTVFFIPFLSASIIFLVSMVFAFLLVEKYDSKDKVVIKDELNPSWKILINRNPPFKRLLPLDAFFKFSMSTAWPIFPFVTLNVVNSWTEVAVMWVLFNLPRGFGQTFGGKYADKIGKKNVLWISRVSYTIVPLGYAFGLIFQNPLILIAVNIPGGLAFGAEETAISTYSLDCSTEETKGRYFSMLLTVQGITAFIGSLFAGIVMDILLRIYGSDSLFSVLFFCLIMIAVLRFVSGMLHKYVYDNPLDFVIELSNSD